MTNFSAHVDGSCAHTGCVSVQKHLIHVINFKLENIKLL